MDAEGGTFAGGWPSAPAANGRPAPALDGPAAGDFGGGVPTPLPTQTTRTRSTPHPALVTLESRLDALEARLDDIEHVAHERIDNVNFRLEAHVSDLIPPAHSAAPAPPWGASPEPAPRP